MATLCSPFQLSVAREGMYPEHRGLHTLGGPAYVRSPAAARNLNTHRHTHTYTHNSHTHTETHTDTPHTHRHTQTDTYTHIHGDTDIHTDTHRQTDTHSFTCGFYFILLRAGWSTAFQLSSDILSSQLRTKEMKAIATKCCSITKIQ